ncbi:MAG TPA: aryl-sulfate sulfotransferase [Saprospiraceae bacterium]|nr:aryl-sulfate sulfotransferase [Saprospiraceae bacterium]
MLFQRIKPVLLLLFITGYVSSQNTVGLISKKEGATDGFTFVYPINQANGYLLDECGQLVNAWPDDPTYMAGAAAYITNAGQLLKTKRKINFAQDKIFAPGAGGIVELRSWDNQLLWTFEINNEKERLHHDIKLMPNNHVLMLVWEEKTKEECIAAGRNPAFISDGKMYNEKIIEVDPATNNITWEWSMWDHLIQDFDSTKANYGVIAEHPEKVDINLNTAGSFGLPNADWMHINSFDYHPMLDQILISAPIFNEIMIIDHSTTTQQAKGSVGGLGKKGGDLLFRWGNPANYRQGTAADQKLFFQHDTKWLIYDIPQNHPDFGKISLFNNRVTATTSWGAILSPPWDMYQWSYTKTGSVYGPVDFERKIIHPNPVKQNSPITSVVQLLPNNHIFSSAGNKGYCYELDKNGELLWEYVLPYRGFGPVSQGSILIPNDNPVFSYRRFSRDFPGFSDKDMGAKGWIELNPDSTYCERLTLTESPLDVSTIPYPNPTSDQISWTNVVSGGHVYLYDVNGIMVKSAATRGEKQSMVVSDLPTGIYCLVRGDLKNWVMVQQN